MLFIVKSVLLLSIFVVLCHCRRRKGELIYDRVRREGSLVYDWTEPLNKIIEGRLLIESLYADFEFFNKTSGTQQDVALNVLYATDCKPFWDEKCTDEINSVVAILNQWKDKLRQEREIFLLLSIRVEITQKLDIDTWNNNILLRIPADRFLVYVMLPEGTTCEDLKNVTHFEWESLMAPRASAFSLNDERAVGLGYGEALIGCKWLNPIIKKTSYLITYINFGETNAAPESFSVLTNHLNSLHERNTAFVKEVSGFNFKDPSIDYYLTSQSSSDSGRVHRLNIYGHEMSLEYRSKMGIIVPIPMKSSSIKKSSVIPYVNAETCHKSINFPWYSPTALQALSQHFNTVVLTHYEWKSLMSQKTVEFYGKSSGDEVQIKFDVILDYSDMLLKDICQYNWTVIQNDLFELKRAFSIQHPLRNVNIIGIIIPVAYPKKNLLTDFTKRLTNSLIMGCAFRINFLTEFDFELTSGLVNSCKNIKGNLYSLQSFIEIKLNLGENDNLYFEKVIRPKIEQLKNLRSLILNQHTTATVYLQLAINVTSYKSTAFCSEEIFRMNEHVEAIVNWAQENNITLILGQAFHSRDEELSTLQGWLDFLRPEMHVRKISEYNPSFILRNYPKGINNWTVDSCIEWTNTPPNLKKNYFRNNNLGAVYDTTVLRSHSTSTEEYKIMLEFILNRFDLVTILIEKDWEEGLNSLSTLASKNLIISNHQLLLNIKLISFPQSEHQVDRKREEFVSFLEKSKEILGTNFSSLKGIHFDWHNLAVFSNVKYQNQSKLQSEYEYPLDGWTLETIQRVETLLDSGNRFGIRTGFLLPISSCIEYIWDSNTSNEWNRHMSSLLNKSSYIVCHYNFEMKDFGSKERLGEILDTHLYAKRLFTLFHVNVDLFFHIEISPAYEFSPTTMNSYLIILSYFKQFGTANNISYLIVNAFDYEYVENGWWKIDDFSDLTKSSVFKEKYSESVGAESWRPPLLSGAAPIVTADIGQFNVLLGSIVFGILIFGGLIATFLYIRRQKQSYLTTEEVKSFLKGRSHVGGNNMANIESDFVGAMEEMHFNTEYELSILDISIDTQIKLGSGNFGTVHKGLANGKPAAIKRPNRDCAKAAFKSVLCEVKILCYIGVHTNVVEFLGAYVKEINKGILCIATEYCSNGSLKSFLEKYKAAWNGQSFLLTCSQPNICQLHIYDLHRFGKEIANGMRYIEKMKVVHRDLSARNVLLNENLTCKISDFGLSRKLYEFEVYVKKSQEALPWRWMAYESLTKREFTSKSDVWSYGVTLWEIYSLCTTPYGERNGASGFVDDLRQGIRLTIPQLATDDIYLRLQDCWNTDPQQRPTFDSLAEFFNSLCHKQYDVLDPIVEANIGEVVQIEMNN